MRLLCDVATNQKHSPFSHETCASVTDCVSGSHKLDYGYTTLAGLPNNQLRRLQVVQHAAARLIFRTRKFDHVTPLFRELHWLPVQQRIQFRLATLAYRCLHGTGPRYLADQLRRVADVESRRRLRSSATPGLVVSCTRDNRRPGFQRYSWSGVEQTAAI